MPQLRRAYSLIEIRSIAQVGDERIVEGVATTPAPDRMDDIVEPLGGKFSLPLPALWQHSAQDPVGHVIKAKATKTGIPFTIRVANDEEPGPLKDFLDKAWRSLKLGLVQAVSIGFRPLRWEYMETGGVRFTEWEWLELSFVTIPANAEATITSIKSISRELRGALAEDQPDEIDQGRKALASIEQTNSVKPEGQAASGRTAHVAKLNTPPASGRPSPSTGSTARAESGRRSPSERSRTMKTYAEQRADFEASRAASAARMKAIMDDSGESGETLDEAQRQEFDGLENEIKAIDDQLRRLKTLESLNLEQAKPVNGQTQEEGSASRLLALPQVKVHKAVPKGIGFTRFVIAQARAKGNIMHAYEIAKNNEQWRAETPDVEAMLKTAVTSGSTSDPTWASPLVNYQILTSEFIDYLRPLTIIGRISGLTMVPFKVKIGRQTGSSTVNWVGEGAPKPLSSLAFDSVTMDLAKIAGIIVLNDELVRLSAPSAEILVRNDLAKSIVQFMDSQFVDPSKAAVTGVSPASITNGVTAVPATGTTGAALRADLKTLIATFLAANMQVSNVVFLMTQQSALGISLMTNALGAKEFPNLNMQGGDLLGIPVITSENIPATGGSPTDGYPIILVSAPDILLADDGDITIDASREASLQMDTAPDSPATSSTTFVSMFQQNMTAIRAERYINWAKRRSGAVQYISNAKYFE